MVMSRPTVRDWPTARDAPMVRDVLTVRARWRAGGAEDGGGLGGRGCLPDLASRA
jgi:hypothetical protein